MPSPAQNTIPRLQQVNQHITPVMSTSFTAEIVPQAPEDPLFGLMTAYRKDTSDDKVDLGIGAYRDDNGKPYILPVVKKVCVCKLLSRLR